MSTPLRAGWLPALFDWSVALRPWLALLLASTSLFLAGWIFIAAPTRALLPLSVGAPEVSAWLVVGALVAIAIAIPDALTRLTSRLGLAAAAVALALALTPLLRFRATARRLDAAARAAFGGDVRRDVATTDRALSRPTALSLGDLFGGVALDGSRVTRDIVVATPGGARLTVDVYRPVREGTFPTVVQIYGGAWQRGAPGDFSNFARWLAARGYVVFAIDYRHAPQARWPAQLDDVRSNLAWIRDHAAEYGADPSRVALLGRSAGAQLAMLGAYTDGPLPIRAVISFYGPVDLVDAYEHPPSPDPLRIREVEQTLFGGPLEEMRDVYRTASPLAWVTRPLPPTLLIYGGRDHIVEPRYGARLRDRLAATGTTVLLLDIPWADHAFDEVFNGPSSQLALYHVERFLAWAMRNRPGPPASHE